MSMEDKALPRSFKTASGSPVELSVEQNRLCKRLDIFHSLYGLKAAPSEMFRGAVFASHPDLRHNPDWMAQAANSLREILYPFLSGSSHSASEKGVVAFNKFGSVRMSTELISEVWRVWKCLNDLTHHVCDFSRIQDFSSFSAKDFEKLFADFEIAMKSALDRQFDVHQEIEGVLAKSPEDWGSDPAPLVKSIHEILELNYNTRHYFFSKADVCWLEWLWLNGFLDEIKTTPKDKTQFSNRMPELDYIARTAVNAPVLVTEMILSVPNTPATFNSAVVDRFLFICAQLPVEQISRIAPKIRNEGWSRLMAGFGHWGFEYEKILNKLAEAKDYSALLLIAEDVLRVREVKAGLKDATDASHGLFCFNGLSHSNVFEQLSDVPDQFAEDTLRLAVKVMSEIVLLAGPQADGTSFGVKDAFYLYSVDFFELKLGKERRLGERDNIQELAALIKSLAIRLIGNKRTEESETSNLFNKYFKNLPDSASMYRLRIYIVSLCPEIFRDEIHKIIFGIFEKEAPWDLLDGAEYEQLLKRHFSILNEDERGVYISKAIALFAKEEGTKNTGCRILSCIYAFLRSEDKQLAEGSLGTLDETYKPKPLIDMSHGGYVIDQAPGCDEDWGSSVGSIVEKLKNEWAPQTLKETFRENDFLRPTNTEGAGNRLRTDLEARPLEYLEQAELFFDRESLHPHYTYSFLRGISDLLRSGKVPVGADLSTVLSLMVSIRSSNASRALGNVENARGSGWLSSWDAVHSTMVDILRGIFDGEYGRLVVDFKVNRPRLFELVQYLLEHKDPELKDEQIETAKSKTKSPDDPDYVVTDPYTNATNSVRGKAFLALMAFVFHDGKRLEEMGETNTIDKDVIALYERTLKNEDTRALMFLFGHHIPTLYHRDADWLHRILPLIFSSATHKEHLHLAALEGYFANNLYREVFFDPNIQQIYRRAILFPPRKDNRKYFRDPDESLATHLALAFVYFFDVFGINHCLFRIFWFKSTDESRREFISFIGRLFVSGSNQEADNFLRDNPEAITKIKEFWEWAVSSRYKPELLMEFGYWINPDKKLFDLKWLTEQTKATLIATRGQLEWDHGLNRYIVVMARDCPNEALSILRLNILEAGVRQERGLLFLHDEWVDALRILHDNHATNMGAGQLINDLLHEGGSAFWKLEDILKGK